MNATVVKLKLEAKPQRLTLAQRQRFRISLTATNQGSEIIDPELHNVRLFVNGQQSKAWSLAIGNGRREDKWFALPPGDTVAMTWSSLGEALFPEAGEFTLMLRYGDTELDPIQVQVHA